jgi:predicted thioesterase
MMIALMEQAACECISDCLESGQTSVGMEINAKHTAASPIGAEITATATIDFVFGRKIEFSIIAHEEEREIGTATHTRIIVDSEKFMGMLKKR